MDIISALRTARRTLLAVPLIVISAGFAAVGIDATTAKTRSPYTSDVTIESKYLKRGFIPDGNVAKPEWAKANWVHFNQQYQGREEYPEAKTEVASLWTKEHIYFAYRAHYTTLNAFKGEDPAQERWRLWERDVVEVFINPRPDHVNQYYEFEISPNNQWLDLEIDLDKDPFTNEAWDSHFDHATRVDEEEKVWTCELRIPLKSMKVSTLRPGEYWRLNFYRMDGMEEGTKPRRLMSWSAIPPPNNGYHTPTSFGMIRFAK